MIKKMVKKIIGYLPVPNREFIVEKVTLSPNELLKGRCAFITGGTSGIGFHITKAFLNSGATVVITSREEVNLKNSYLALDPEGLFENRLFGVTMNNSMINTFHECFEEALNKVKNYGNCSCIDILVNNAGILGGNMPNATELEYDMVIDTNLKGAFFLSQLIGKYFKDNNVEGNILNIASSSSLRPATSAYSISKWGVRGMTIGLAKSLAPFGITVNGLAPGPTATPMLLGENRNNISNKKNPIGRYALPDEIANMAVVLVSSMGKTIVGDIVYMTGGAGIITYDDIKYVF